MCDLDGVRFDCIMANARDAWDAFLKAKAEATEAFMKAIRQAWDEYEKAAAQTLERRT